MWIEIFKGGRQTDSSGREHDGDDLIDSAVASFDEKNLPPLVLGHPMDDSPAYGWVNGVKATVEGGVKRLLADIAPVEALRDWVNEKLYTNRSSAFYPDGRLRHVGFLGGMPPAVKGLAPLPAFNDGVDTMILFETKTPQEKREDGRMKFSEFLQMINVFKKFGGKDDDIDLISTPPEAYAAAIRATFTEADIDEAKKKAAIDAAADERKKIYAEFAEAEKARKTTDRKERIKTFCDEGVKAGKIAPSWVSDGLATFMEQLPDDGILFSEGAEKKTAETWFREFIDGMPKLINFSEIATRGKSVGVGDASQKLVALTKQKMKQFPDISYNAAFSEVQAEHQELAYEYCKQMDIKQ